jgi:hypothetical protein
MKAPDNRIAPSVQAYVDRAVQRDWSFVLSADERTLLLRIVDVTVGRGRLQYRLSLAKLVAGEWADGSRFGGPLGLSYKTAQRALARLKQLGVIQAKGDPSGMLFIVDPDHIIQAGKIVREEAVGIGQADLPIGHSDLTIGQADLHKRENQRERTRESEPENHSACGEPASADASRSGSPERAFAGKVSGETSSGKTKIEASAEKSLEELNAASPKNVPANMLAVINASLPDALPKVTWAGKHYGMAKAIADRWHPSAGGLGDFVLWTASEWDRALKRRFRWMKQVPFPTTYDVQFVLKFFDVVYDAYNDRAKTDRENDLKLSSFERALAKGVPLDEIVKNAQRAAFRQGEAKGKQDRPYQPRPVFRPRPEAMRTDPADHEPRPVKLTPQAPAAPVGEDGYAIFVPRLRRDFVAYEDGPSSAHAA